MYLSRIRVDLNGLSRTLLFDVMGGRAYAAHQLLWRLFPDHENDDRPFLFRQEIEADEVGDAPKGLPLFYMLSSQMPTPIDGLLDVDTKAFEPRLAPGDRLAFRLRANPTVARSPGNGARSKRADVLMDAKKSFTNAERRTSECAQAMNDAARDWLESRARDFGFSLPGPLECGAYRQHTLKKTGVAQPIQFSSVDYEGLMDVVDPTRLLHALSAGLGRAKAFGCGLMLIRRVG